MNYLLKYEQLDEDLGRLLNILGAAGTAEVTERKKYRPASQTYTTKKLYVSRSHTNSSYSSVHLYDLLLWMLCELIHIFVLYMDHQPRYREFYDDASREVC